MVDDKILSLLQFDTVIDRICDKCLSPAARQVCLSLRPSASATAVLPALHQTAELLRVFSHGAFFPSVEHEDISHELRVLRLEGGMLNEEQLLRLMGTVESGNTLARFLRSKRAELPELSVLASDTAPLPELVTQIGSILDPQGEVRSQASPELAEVRRSIAEKRRESDRRFYAALNELRREGFLRDNEEGFFNGRRTLAVMVEHKSEVSGFVHGKSESGRTVFIEPGATIAINNDIAELVIDERREISRILRELCNAMRPHAAGLLRLTDLLVTIDALRARALFAFETQSVLPTLTDTNELRISKAVHPLLFLQNKRNGKTTVPLSVTLDDSSRIIVISGPNAGGKTIALKTAGLLQIMLQCGLLVPAGEDSVFPFFSKLLVDIGDAQSIENELSTYSARLKRMTNIIHEADERSLVLMDEFGSGTDPDLGSAIAEVVLENLVESQARGIITSHFGNVKILAGKLEGAVNASMLFDLETLTPRYMLSIGEPGSSYTFEVAGKAGFPAALVHRARSRVDKDRLKLTGLLAEVQEQKTRLEDLKHDAEHEAFLARIAREKYQLLFNNWEEKISREREKKIELARLAEYGKKYLRLMEEWNEKKDRKMVIKKFIDGITAETRIRETQLRQNKRDAHAEKKIARLKPLLKIGSLVRVLNSSETGIVEEMRDDKVVVKLGIMKITVGIENLALAE